MCDWNGCDDSSTAPAVVKLHEHDDAHADDAYTDAYTFDLCVAHTSGLVQFLQGEPLHKAGV